MSMAPSPALEPSRSLRFADHPAILFDRGWQTTRRPGGSQPISPACPHTAPRTIRASLASPSRWNSPNPSKCSAALTPEWASVVLPTYRGPISATAIWRDKACSNPCSTRHAIMLVYQNQHFQVARTSTSTLVVEHHESDRIEVPIFWGEAAAECLSKLGGQAGKWGGGLSQALAFGLGDNQRGLEQAV